MDKTLTQCEIGSMSGVYAFELEAPGYAPLQVEETIEKDMSGGCCRCGYIAIAETVAVAMTPAP